jgi:hypothetical protein
MTSGSDDLEQELRRNLKLRRELGAEAARGKAALNEPNSAAGSFTVGERWHLWRPLGTSSQRWSP